MFSVLILLIILTCTTILYLLLKQISKKRLSPPGPIQLPIVGNLLQIRQSSPPYIELRKLTKKYGPIVSLRLGSMDVVVIDDLELTKELFDREDWSDHYYHEWVSEARSFGQHLGILFSNGECWKEMRKFLIRTLSEFGFGKQNQMESSINAELHDFLIDGVRNRIANEGNILSIKKFFTISILNILWSMVADLRFSHDDKRLTNLLQIIDQIIKESAIGSMFIMAFPFLRHILPKFSGIESQKRNHGILQQFFKEALDEKRKTGAYKNGQKNDFMDVFLSEIDKYRKNPHLPGASQYTEEQLIVVGMDLFMAGSDSTSSTLEFAVLFLILNTSIQEKLRKELENVVGRERFPNLSDKPNLPYLEAFILEVHRKGSILPIMMRSPTRDSIVRDYVVKKGTVGFFNVHHIHNNPALWTDTETFRPERFLNEDETKIINNDKIMPLGYGRRKCLGTKLVEANLFMFLSYLIHQYELKPSPNHPIPKFEQEMGHILSTKEFFVQFIERTD